METQALPTQGFWYRKRVRAAVQGVFYSASAAALSAAVLLPAVFLGN